MYEEHIETFFIGYSLGCLEGGICWNYTCIGIIKETLLWKTFFLVNILLYIISFNSSNSEKNSSCYVILQLSTHAREVGEFVRGHSGGMVSRGAELRLPWNRTCAHRPSRCLALLWELWSCSCWDELPVLDGVCWMRTQHAIQRGRMIQGLLTMPLCRIWCDRLMRN